MTTIDALKRYVRATNYLAAAQIYLRDNTLLEKPLAHTDIKPRLLGHWGTCPGINFTYAQLNALITEKEQEMMFVLGPGHGFPALQANLFLEGSLGDVDVNLPVSAEGIAHLCKNFSWPYGYPSHSNPEAPGVILEGGELGYALATAYGTVLDNPNLVTAVLIGDGEAETGPTATAWHCNKFVDPKTSGAVLPIVHVNGYKISGPTIYGRMTDTELAHLFTGYGYTVYIVDASDPRDVYAVMQATLKAAHVQIHAIQDAARSSEVQVVEVPKWPMIILRTPKGWTGIAELDGEKLEGNHLSHQVIAKEAATNPAHLSALETWLRSYNFPELFTKGAFAEDIRAIIPPAELRMGASKHARGGSPAYTPLELPDIATFTEDATVPGTVGSSSMRRAGAYLTEVFARNNDAKNFRLFSPDETYSNKLDDVFTKTARAWVGKRESWDKDLAPNGRVMEMLSEHTLQGMYMGYVLTGRHGIFASYEAFIQIVVSMVDQYAKFLKIARSVSWRGKVPSLNYILTSSGWRQDHNGFSHQNPGFVDDMLNRQGCFVNAYYPPDGNTTLACLRRCLASTQEINIITAGKTLEPRWLTPAEAQKAVDAGIMTWDFASDDRPDIVIATIGDYLTKEGLAALDIVKQETPNVRIRFVNIITLNALGIGSGECVMPHVDFNDYFTHDKPVLFNFHGYPQTLKQMLFEYACNGSGRRFLVHGYEENGSTTTPFDMHIRNNTDRYSLAIEVWEEMVQAGVVDRTKADELIKQYRKKLTDHRAYIIQNGTDPEEIDAWTWTPRAKSPQ
ncbi:phosphoketolase [Candidatus Kaiserbacteria bacterium RIFCSPHIGHO2_02_FULL_50_50]|uniref:Phosphoketolase n=1 Tax=Candidatus Kaiserbacteria bacterium RIFCSPHIGHO2_02_FULL_50_50 TaxID=1798492 RepID=A0A1F6DC64_9BACT|nr:MAG: phosphoketolase [Candidatus Kaiserbacteria bacterium RIFCSPHIGHO2_02_FULL_50_50]